jgi:hypothetical protein
MPCILFLERSTVQPTSGNEVITNPADIIPFHVVGNEGGFFPSAVETSQVLLGPAERYDIVIDFSTLPAGEWQGLFALTVACGCIYVHNSCWALLSATTSSLTSALCRLVSGAGCMPCTAYRQSLTSAYCCLNLQGKVV